MSKVRARDKRRKILLIDDDENMRMICREALLYQNYAVIEASNGTQGLEQLKNHRPDLILLDIMMPKMSGFEVCRRLKNDPKNADIPVIMVTALSEFGDIERGIDSGTDDFLSKPVNKLELLTRVKTMLRLKHLTDKLERTLAYLNEIEKQAQTAKSDAD